MCGRQVKLRDASLTCAIPERLMHTKHYKLEMWANAQVMAALPNIDGALCSTPQSLVDAQYLTAVQ